ncbi:Cell division protein FtsZ [Achromobacter anxifer]|uniref:cell division protein FtsZ n=1 Tax=Achromobacter anxifer TaxID=1287737 RepID=UPI00155B6C5D|nr:cell division protein FtsZ [Achromobacter anxifer]CAB5514674.1 Cell division protein FtsZ [Achromobacter anxifer]
MAVDDGAEFEGTRIKVIGVGGGGSNAVEHMVASGVQGVQFIAANTDSQALTRSSASIKLPLGRTGLGAGAKPEKGQEAALAQRAEIRQALEGAHMVFVTAGMGGGTGTGAAPVVAEVAREMGILTVGVVTKPFSFEGQRRMRAAEAGIQELSRHVDSLITVLNDRLITVLGEDADIAECFEAADNVLRHAVGGIAEIITFPGLVNVDFEDVRTVMTEMGRAMMGSATASGPDRAQEAAEQAVASPLLEGVNLTGAKGVLVNISAARNGLKMREVNQIMSVVEAFASPDAHVIFGAVYDESLGDAIRVTVVATGLDGDMHSQVQHQPVLRRESADSNAEVLPGIRPAPIQPMRRRDAQSSPAPYAGPAHRAPAGAGPGEPGQYDRPAVFRVRGNPVTPGTPQFLPNHGGQQDEACATGLADLPGAQNPQATIKALTGQGVSQHDIPAFLRASRAG